MPPHRRGFLFAHRAPAHALFDPALFLPNGDAIDEVLLGGHIENKFWMGPDGQYASNDRATVAALSDGTFVRDGRRRRGGDGACRQQGNAAKGTYAPADVE
jgi:hypothetical protein